MKLKQLMKKLGLTVLMALPCIFMSSLTANAKGQVRISLKMDSVSIEKVMEAIEAQTNYLFLNDRVDVSKKISVDVKDVTLDAALEKIFSKEGISYKIQGANIYIYYASISQDNGSSEQKSEVSGVVLDSEGLPIIGASVLVKGTVIGASTDLDGKFSFILPEAYKQSQLEVSCIGYRTITKAIGKQRAFEFVLEDDAELLEGTVVTALGIRKEAKSLTYNLQEVSNESLTTVKDANFINSLSGKVAGVIINSSSSGIGGGSKVVMRGAKSITGNNNALYVIDGIPMPSLSTTQPDDKFTGMGQSGDGASMVNPEDIEKISVLSGAAASALYGTEAANGVILITTKKGSTDESFHLSYSNSTSFFSPFVTPRFQNTYGATETGAFASWGQKLATASSYNPTDFFQTGFNETNALTISTGSKRNQTFLSLASTNAEGIVANNCLDRYNLSIRNTTDFFNDKMHLDLSASIMDITEQNMVAQGQYFNPLVPVYLMSPSYGLDNIMIYKQYTDPDRNYKTQYWPYGNNGMAMQNPYWVTNEDMFQNHKNRYIYSAGLSYDIIKGLKVSGRAKLDKTEMTAEKKYSASTDGIFAGEYGAYYRDNSSTQQIYADAMLNYDRYFGKFSVTAALGASLNDIQYGWYSMGGDLNSVANHFTTLNLNPSKIKINQDNYHEQTQSVFGTLQMGWRSCIYLDLTARNDWSSALAYTDYNSVFYPSVGLSFILTDLFGIKSNALSFLKVRGSYSEVGNAPTRFIANPGFPYNNFNPTSEATYPNSNIQPERTKAWEVGLESHFWQDKLNFNISLYKTSTFNQLFNPELSSTSGYEKIYINGGQVDNKGIEASLSLNQNIGPIMWTSSLTYTANRNKIVKLLGETTLDNGEVISQSKLDIGGLDNAMIRLVEGGSMGDLYVTALATDEHGNVIVDFTDNTVYVDRQAGPYGDGWIYAGNVSAKHNLGWRNSFNWKGINLDFLITARLGGVVFSATQGFMDQYGVSETTAIARDNGGALVNGYRIDAQKFYQTVGASVGSYYVYDATNVRLAELSIGYDIPVNNWTNWIKGLNVAFTAHNLFMFYCNAPFDPELTASTGTFFQGMDYFMNPSLRSMGFSAKLKF